MLSAKRLMLAFAAFERALIREPLRKGNRPATAACGAYHARKRTVLNGLPSRCGDLRGVRGPVRRATGSRTYDAELDLLGITINCPGGRRCGGVPLRFTPPLWRRLASKRSVF